MADIYAKSFTFNNGDTWYPLPIVTAEQNGMVLKVGNGEWEAGEIVYEPIHLPTPGLYDSNDVIIASWSELINTYGMNISKDYTYSNYNTDNSSPYYVLANNSTLSAGTSLIIKSNTNNIGDYAFYGYTALTMVELPAALTTLGMHAFDSCINLALIKLPEGLTGINMYAFAGCTNLNITELPAGVNFIGDFAFSRCSKLKTITFKGTPTSTISSMAFGNCNNLTDIYVPWAEGAVANAPWSATNATIHYNYTA